MNEVRKERVFGIAQAILRSGAPFHLKVFLSGEQKSRAMTLSEIKDNEDNIADTVSKLAISIEVTITQECIG